MPWLCNSRKKRPERSKFIIGDSRSSHHSKDDSVISNGQPIFTVVLQDFQGSVNDELSVQRGQVLEALYTDGDWLYVRNVDGIYGYVPDTFCYRLEQTTQWNGVNNRGSNSPRLKQRPQSIAIDARSSTNSMEVHQNHTSQPRSSTPKPAVSQDAVIASSNSTPLTPRSTNRLSGLPGRRSPGDSPVLARSSRSVHVPMRTDCEALEERYTELPQCSRSMAEQPLNRSIAEQPLSRSMVEQPLNRSVVEQPLNRSMAVEQPASRSMVEQPASRSMVEQPLKRSVAEQPASRSKHTSRVRRSASLNKGTKLSKVPLRRSQSYQEAMLADEDNMYVMVTDVQLTKNTDEQSKTVSHDQPIHNANYERNRSSDQSCDIASRRAQFSRMNSCPTRMMNSDPIDDVFFETRKPLGIYRCLQTYTPKFKGEIALRENELVILSDYGRRDWSWIITSTGAEGLIPKRLLVRYSPELGVGGTSRRCPPQTINRMSDATTQTELVISAPTRQVSSASSASVGPSASSSNSSFNSRSSPSSHKQQEVERTNEERVETMMASSAVQTSDSPTPWFENIDSLERPLKPTKHHVSKLTENSSKSRATELKPTSCPAKGNNRPAKHGVRPVKLWRDRPPKLDLSPRRHTLSSLPSSSPGPLSFPGVLPSPCVLALSGPDTECDNMVLLHSGNKPPVLTARKDYTPPTNAKNCLSLKKGDVLVSQPHMHYPRGWMWVWHSTQRTFGYIPTACVAYTYSVTKTSRQRPDTVEEAV